MAGRARCGSHRRAVFFFQQRQGQLSRFCHAKAGGGRALRGGWLRWRGVGGARRVNRRGGLCLVVQCIQQRRCGQIQVQIQQGGGGCRHRHLTAVSLGVSGLSGRFRRVVVEGGFFQRVQHRQRVEQIIVSLGKPSRCSVVFVQR